MAFTTTGVELSAETSMRQDRSGDLQGRTADVMVVGAGAVGLILALALARAGLSVISLGPIRSERNGRTVALLDGSVRMLAALGLWPALAPRAAALATMRIVDDTGSLFRVPPVRFEASEIGLDAFGYNVENADLVEVLSAAVATTPGLTRHGGLLRRSTLAADHVTVETDTGDRLSARVLVAADGARSPARIAAGIGSRTQTYPQVALTAVLAHDRPHQNISTEFHTRQGPFTLVPLCPADDALLRSSMVWVMRPDEAAHRQSLAPPAFADAVGTQSKSLLGRVRVVGRIGAFPLSRMVADRLVGPRLALAGEAAHALPPIGAQGLNLSLRDAATLVDHLAEAARRGRDLGAPAVLAPYERDRMGDIALRAGAVGALNTALLTDWLSVDFVRGAGLAALAALPGLRREVMRQGLRPRHAVPRLMR